ncbi:FxLD family lantipeptide [Nonomuraea longispora]|uniref:FxLD family lantipeptide n=1 Tax=Nonomuraea longispora TaxID=1848320 RepID=A0A4R4NGB0_9ACTN|nr:FxLD family lanthipeptide [Nonomuraea longispora]TDC08065.1 FxLD family lantipeptide [Nonomuraea longispora]
MSARLAETLSTPAVPPPAPALDIEPDFELDITFVESGPEADRLIRMTDDGCGKTCQSACPKTCA